MAAEQKRIDDARAIFEAEGGSMPSDEKAEIRPSMADASQMNDADTAAAAED